MRICVLSLDSGAVRRDPQLQATCCRADHVLSQTHAADSVEVASDAGDRDPLQKVVLSVRRVRTSRLDQRALSGAPVCKEVRR